MFERSVHVISYLWVRGWEKLGVWNNVDFISDYLYLSSLPMRGDEENLIKKVGAVDTKSMMVVSVVENYENSETLLLMDPVRAAEWKKTFKVNQVEVKVEQQQIEFKDFSSGKNINIESAADAVLKIQNRRQEKIKVLVHCKAGRTRSAIVVACVVAMFDLAPLPENAGKSTRELLELALKNMSVERKQIKVGSDVIETGVKIINTAKNMLNGDIQLDDSLQNKITRLAMNPNIVTVITEMESFNKLIDYRKNALYETGQLFAMIKPVMRVEHIDKFIKSLTETRDGQWLSDILNLTGSIKEFLAAKPYLVRDKLQDQSERETIVGNLRKDIMNFLCLNLECNRHQLEELFEVEAPQPVAAQMV